MSLIQEDGTQILIPQEDLVRASPTGEPLSPFLLTLLYSRGVFPWLTKDGHLLWWCPQPRAILVPSELHVSRSLRKTLRSGRFRVTADAAFEVVLRMCVETRESTWITEDLIRVTRTLHSLGHAHSIEVWREDHLVGGLYGVAIGRLFCGCSMFHTEKDASKVALVHLAEQLGNWGFPFIDCLMGNSHMKRMGIRLISRDAFLRATAQLIRNQKFLGPWTDAFEGKALAGGDRLWSKPRRGADPSLCWALGG